MADIQVALELDDSKYTPKLDTVQKKTKEFTDSAEKGFKIDKEAMDKLGEAAEKVKGKMESLGSALVGIGLAEFAKSCMEAAGKTLDLANSMGVSAAAILEFNVAAAGVGKNSDDVAKMMAKVGTSIEDFINGTGHAREAFGALGITMQDFQTKSRPEIAKMIVAGLAGMEDGAKRTAIATELMTKSWRNTPFKDLNQNLIDVKGSQEGAGKAFESSKLIMDSLEKSAEQLKTQFVIMAGPILEWIGPFKSGTEQAKQKAELLLGVMGLFAAGAAIVGINSVVNAVRSLAGAFGLTAGAGRAEAIALTQNATATMASALSKIKLAEAGYAAKVASLEMSVAAEVEAGNIQNATIANRMLTTAKANLAMASGQAAVAVKMGAIAEGEEAVAANAATSATGRLAGAMGTLRTATVTFLGPVGAAIAAIGSLAAVGQAIWGKNGIANGGNGANFISDMLGITDSAGDEARADMQKQMAKLDVKPVEAEKKKDDSSTTAKKMVYSDEDSNKQKIASLRAQAEAQKQNNLLAQEKINLEVAMVGSSNEEKAAAMANFEAYAQGQKEILKLDNEIAQAKAQKSDPNKEGPARVIAELEKQKKLVDEQVQSQMALNSENAKTLAQAQNAEAYKLALLKDQVSVNKNIADINQQIAQITMSKTQVAAEAVTKEIHAQIKALEDQIVSETHMAVTADQHAKIEAQVTAEYQKQKEAQDQLTAKQREFSTGWTQAWHEWQDNATNASQVGKSLFTSMIGNVDSAFKNMIHGTQTDWRSMVDNMVTMMMEADFNRLIATSIGSGKGSGSNTSGGGFFGGFADGGSIPAGGYGVVGENGPEYVNGPAKITPSGGASQIGTSSSTNVNYTIHANDAQSFKQMLAKDPQFLYAVSLKGQRGMPGGV